MGSGQELRINADRLASRIERLAGIGPTRLAFTEEDRRARALVMTMMREAGLAVRIDAAGNILGRRDGRRAAPPILFGSHIDTVPNGGRFDGVLGCLAGIECVQTLNEAGARTEHPLEVVVFANEEGQNFTGLSGSRAMAGLLDEAELSKVDRSGRTFAQAIESLGGQPERIAEAARKPGEILAYIELHVEQGGVLESMRVPIGIVSGIVGILYSSVRMIGRANHSGTTPMRLRRDALIAASHFVIEVDATVRSGEFCAVGTVGRLEVLPNSRNVIPGEVRMILELRDLDPDKIARTYDHLRLKAAEISNASGVSLEFARQEAMQPATADPAIMEAIKSAAAALGLPYHVMPSGAGHDAQMIARIAPMGMIFVPSSGGISHSSDEFTSIEDCANGANVLLQTILKIDSWGE